MSHSLGSPLGERQQVRHAVEPHDHAVCFYPSAEELAAPLRTFVESAHRADALPVFVHSFDDASEAWSLLDRAASRSDPPSAWRRDLVVVSLYTDAFEAGARRIDHEHVTRVIEGLLDRAERDGRNGVRVFVDASRRYLAEGRAAEWFAFESWLGRRLATSVGLVCAYQEDDARRADVLPEDELRTHAYRFDIDPAA